MNSRRGRRAASEGDTRQLLIRAARKCFGRYGYDRTTNADIAGEAKITTGAIYHYFDSKADLFTAATKGVEEIVLLGLRAAIEASDTTVEKLGKLLDAAVNLGEQGQDLARFVAIAPVELERREEFRDLHKSLFGEVVGFFSDIITEGKRRGEVAADIDVQAAADLLLASFFGIALQAGLYGDQVSLREVVAVYHRLLEGRFFTRSAQPAAEDTPQSRSLHGLQS